MALAGETVVMEARPVSEDIITTPFVSYDEASRASEGFPGWTYHGATACFVCGPDRIDATGLRIFPGPVGDSLVAATWTPSSELAGPDGTIPQPILWGVLDCPGAWAAAAYDPEGMPYFPTLGTMEAVIVEPVVPGEPLVVVGRHRHTERRKLSTDVALYTRDGVLKGRSDHIEIKLFEYDETA